MLHLVLPSVHGFPYVILNYYYVISDKVVQGGQDGGRVERAQLGSHAHPGSLTPAGAGEQQRTQKQRERRGALPSTKIGAMPRPKAVWRNVPGRPHGHNSELENAPFLALNAR
ncbi:hypothetical protein NDU88_005421 [Pleurodeles waltl]|uniref:Uncharacterized protein n=1 Tax=Pleurodeles waltl TaxID=8319 RepID=A0AAV7RIG8_PLEWA|nr:hypothetical protein NDU88_005421 [Pleurodeles waltl]